MQNNNMNQVAVKEEGFFSKHSTELKYCAAGAAAVGVGIYAYKKFKEGDVVSAAEATCNLIDMF